MANPAIDLAAVCLELRLARSARTDSAAKLRHLHTASCQPRKQVFQLRQLNLHLSFSCSGMTRKNIENELRAVDHSNVEFALQVALLRRSQFVVEDHQVGINRC